MYYVKNFAINLVLLAIAIVIFAVVRAQASEYTRYLGYVRTVKQSCRMLIGMDYTKASSAEYAAWRDHNRQLLPLSSHEMTDFWEGKDDWKALIADSGGDEVLACYRAIARHPEAFEHDTNLRKFIGTMPDPIDVTDQPITPPPADPPLPMPHVNSLDEITMLAAVEVNNCNWDDATRSERIIYPNIAATKDVAGTIVWYMLDHTPLDYDTVYAAIEYGQAIGTTDSMMPTLCPTLEAFATDILNETYTSAMLN